MGLKVGIMTRFISRPPHPGLNLTYWLVAGSRCVMLSRFSIVVLYPKRIGIRFNANNTCYLNLYNRKVKIKFMIIGLIVFIYPNNNNNSV